MDRPTYEDRQKRRYQPASDDRNRFDTQLRSDREDLFTKGEARESDRAFTNVRNYRDGTSEQQPWNPGNHERVNARPVSYQDLGSQSSSNNDRDSHLYQDTYGSDRNSGSHGTWDDRSLRSQRFDSSYPTSFYGSSFGGKQRLPPNGNANQAAYENASQASFGRDDQDNFGSYGSGQTFSRNGLRGNRQRSDQGTQGYSPTHYSTQHSGSDFGQHYGTGQQLYGNDSFAPNKSGRELKGSIRSDERIREEVCDLLSRHPDIDLAEVDIQVSGAGITLTGTIDSRHETRLIEDLASSVSGVTEVNNQLRVRDTMGSVRSQQLDSETT
jgi:hypothetical protein